MGFDFLNDSENQTPFACVTRFSVFFASYILVFCVSVICLSAQYSEMFSKVRIHRMKGSTLPVSEALTPFEGTLKSAPKRIVSGFLRHNC